MLRDESMDIKDEAIDDDDTDMMKRFGPLLPSANVPGMRPMSITKTGKIRNTHYVYGSGRNSTKVLRRQILYLTIGFLFPIRGISLQGGQKKGFS